MACIQSDATHVINHMDNCGTMRNVWGDDVAKPAEDASHLDTVPTALDSENGHVWAHQ